MNRRAWIRQIRKKPRRGRIRSVEYLEWIHQQPCVVSGKYYGVTAHHVRQFGSPKNDYRTLPLLPQYHMHGFGPLTIEHGKQQFEEAYGVSIEAEIVRLNAKYEAETGRMIEKPCIPVRFAQ